MVTKKKPMIEGTDDDMRAAMRAVFEVFDVLPQSSYTDRCADMVAIGQCGAGRMGMKPGRYPCSNEALPGEPFCAGPCHAMTVFYD